MNYNDMIRQAIEKNEVEKLLRGDGLYKVEMNKFTPDVFPTDVNAVLVNCFYKEKNNIKNIKSVLEKGMLNLLLGSVSDSYIAVIYFDTCLFQEEKNNATFEINKEMFIGEMRKVLSENKSKLEGEILFNDKTTKKNGWRNVENFNNYYTKKYGFSIIDESLRG